MKKIINTILLAGLLANATAFANAGDLQLSSAAGAEITISSASDAIIRQTEPKQILDWQTLNLNSGELIKFNQNGNGDWSTLNRINSMPTNSIFGKIKQEGSLYLINPNGVLFPEGNVTFGCTSGLSVSTSNGLTIGCQGNLSVLGGYIQDGKKISLIGGSFNLEEGSSLISPLVSIKAESINIDGTIVTGSGELIAPNPVYGIKLISMPLITAVPEPSTYLMMLLGLVGITGVARRKA